MASSCWLHYRLRLCRKGRDVGMTFSCWPHWRLRLCRRGGEGWQVDADFNVGYGCVGGREGGGGFMLDSLQAVVV